MNDLVAVQVCEAVEYTFCYLAQNLFARPPAKLLDFSVDSIETTPFTILHCNGSSTARVESTVVSADML